MSSDLPLLWTDVPLHLDALALLRTHVRLAGPNLPAGVAVPGEIPAADAAIVGAQRTWDAATFALAPWFASHASTMDAMLAQALKASGVDPDHAPAPQAESTNA